ncbi:MAG: asparagine synthase [Xanthomonadales bacterium]|nr:asparagine synthase [Xanthomonadales bacterium]
MTRYWSIDDHFSSADGAGIQAADFHGRYRELFEDSVRRQLMSDVPLGIFLSGGVDSALITAAAAAQETGLHCFTVNEEATRMSGDLDQARRVAGHFGNPLHILDLDQDEVLGNPEFDLAELERMVWTMDSPRFSLEIYFKYRLHRFVKSRFPEIKVVLIGQGADEFCGGYTNEHGDSFSDWPEYVENAALPILAAFDDLKKNARWPIPEAAFDVATDSQRPVFHRIMQMHVTSLQFYNLWHEDRTSSAHGIEARVPFLDHRLVELAASVPPALHSELFWDKQIVRAMIPELLPAYPADRPKVPFIDVPGNRSIRHVYAGILNRVFPDFQQQYPYFSPGTPLGEQARILRSQATAGNAGWYTQARKLLHIMCTAIFERRCQQA